MELRKNKKDDMLSKRRNVATDEEPLSPLQVFIISGSGYIFGGKTKKKFYFNLQYLVKGPGFLLLEGFP